MQSFKKFLEENYEMSEKDFENADTYTKRIIENEWDAYTESIIN